MIEALFSFGTSRITDHMITSLIHWYQTERHIDNMTPVPNNEHLFNVRPWNNPRNWGLSKIWPYPAPANSRRSRALADGVTVTEGRSGFTLFEEPNHLAVVGPSSDRAFWSDKWLGDAGCGTNWSIYWVPEFIGWRKYEKMQRTDKVSYVMLLKCWSILFSIPFVDPCGIASLGNGEEWWGQWPQRWWVLADGNED
jgi:hypothetical protein